jgi:calcineurin-like phosphoesterase
MTPELSERLFAAGIDLLTGGNHSWDGPYGQTIHEDPRILRPLNCSDMPGRGAAIVSKPSGRLGVVNLISPLIMPGAGDPYHALESQLAQWQGLVDWVMVDFHGESVTEKQSFGHAVSGKVLAVLGTHTHVQTLDTQILGGKTAYVSDVGMTGPSGGVQGYAPDFFVNYIRQGQPQGALFALAAGQLELGAVLVSFDAQGAHYIQRLR